MWEVIHSELTDLNWLTEDAGLQQDILIAALRIGDTWARATLKGQQRFCILQLNRVKIFLNNMTYSLNRSRENQQIVSFAFRKQVQELSFFQKARSLLSRAENDNDSLRDNFLVVNQTYSFLQDMLVNSLTHMDKILKIEFGKSLKDYLGSRFYENVVLQFKLKLKQIEECQEAIQELEQANAQRSGWTNSTSSTYQGPSNYGTVYSQSYAYSRENVYFGELDQNGLRAGYGQITYYNGDSYEGQWNHDKPHGIGVYRWRDGGRYEGEFEMGKPHGKGKRVYSTGGIYVGEFNFGKKHGRGEMRYKNGDRYVGDWEDDEMHGEGVYIWESGDQYEGPFVRDKREGKGILIMTTGERHEGKWKDNQMKEKPAPTEA